ncbi:MAG TPA: transposase [Gemmatimonadaceae bacterium]|nr:transposase [Gemmatimonadaceae bacterium]
MEAAIRPHKSRYWLNPRIDDPVAHEKQVGAVCEIYRRAPELEAARIHVVSCDEKTSIQALERSAPTKPTRPHLDERREFEYKRNGTLCLIANLAVATGKILAPTVGPTRGEADFAEHILRTIATDPQAGWIFVADNLTTHCSESLVRLVAKEERIDADLGTKGSKGILLNVESRRRFLCDESHRIRFVFTPKHCSWLNQIEIWFSILVRRALKRASFKSTDELREAILAFIRYFNDVLAKPFRWTYTGKVLAQ